VAAHDLTGREGGFPRADEGTRTLDTWLGKWIRASCGVLSAPWNGLFSRYHEWSPLRRALAFSSANSRLDGEAQVVDARLQVAHTGVEAIHAVRGVVATSRLKVIHSG
jgi:hypothetical protein